MIDEKKLIEELRMEYECVDDLSYFACGVKKGLSQAISIIKYQPKVGEWIPCSERLPEPYKPVLLCYIGFNDKVAYSDGIALVDYNGNWIWAFDENYEDEIKNEVIAWMPLPEPYEVEEDD